MAAQVTAIQDRLSLTLAEAKEFLRIPAGNTSHDSVITLLISAAKSAADQYCQRKFLDEDGNPAAIPDGVKLGVLTLVARKFENRALGLQITGLGGVGYSNWSKAELSEAFWQWKRLTGLGAGIEPSA